MQGIAIGVAAADEEEGGREFAARHDLLVPELGEAPKGGEARAGADHDDGDGRDVEREVEGCVRGADGHVHAVARHELGQVGGGGAVVLVRWVGERGRGQDGVGECAGVRGVVRRGGDAVLAHPQRGQHGEEIAKGELDGRVRHQEGAGREVFGRDAGRGEGVEGGAVGRVVGVGC